MSDFILKKHRVREASFTENTEKEKKNDMEVGVEGGILVPKAHDEMKHVAISLKLHLGKEDERLYLMLETLSIFETDNENADKSEEAVRKACLPVALANLRRTVKMVTEAYGMPALDLPPFEEENMER